MFSGYHCSNNNKNVFTLVTVSVCISVSVTTSVTIEVFEAVDVDDVDDVVDVADASVDVVAATVGTKKKTYQFCNFKVGNILCSHLSSRIGC